MYLRGHNLIVFTPGSVLPRAFQIELHDNHKFNKEQLNYDYASKF